MKISQKIAAVGVAGVLGVTGIAVLGAPVALAATTTQDGAPTVGDRVQAITEALAGLVGDGTLTQEQADEVATTLDGSDVLRGPGHGGGRGALSLDAAAEALGLTTDELRSALDVDGTTLADVAAERGVETSVLVDALVGAATERLTQEVEDGRLTQEEADERIAALPEWVAAHIEEEPRGGGGHGRRGGGGPGDRPDEDAGATADEATGTGQASTTVTAGAGTTTA